MTRQRLAVAAVWFAVFASLVFLPGALNRWVFPKEVVLLLACVLASRLQATGRVPRWLWAVIAAGALILVVTALQSDAPLMQLLGRWPRYEGAITLAVYVAALWLGSVLLGPTTTASRQRLWVSAVSVGSLALGVVSVLEALGLKPISTTADRPGALLGNATDQGILAVMFFAVLAVPLVRAWVSHSAVAPGKNGKIIAVTEDSPWLPVLGLLASLATLVISASRGALVGFGVVIVGLTILEVARRRVIRRSHLVAPLSTPRARVIAASVAVAAVALAALAFPLLVLRVLGLTPLSAATVEDRALIYDAAVRVVMQNPVVGVGPSGFVDAVPPLLGAEWYSTVGQDTVLTSAHNWILQAAVAGGIGLAVLAIGLAIVALVVGVLRWSASLAVLSTQRRADHVQGSGLALAGFGVALLTHFTTPGTTMFAALLLGSLLAVAPIQHTVTVVRELGSWARTIALALGVLVIAALAWSEVPLRDGVAAAAAGDVDGANASFSASLALRSWDADTASIAAQSLAQAAEQQVPGAADLAVAYGVRALSATPGSVSAAKALAVGQQYSGDVGGAVLTLRDLAKRVPLDAGVAQRLGGVLILRGEFGAAETELLRATELDPLNPAPWLTLEYLYQQTGDAAAEATAHQTAARLTTH